MAQDFAKQRSNPDGGKRKRAATRPSQPGSANWSWFFSGLMTGVIVSIAAYLGVLKLEEGVAEDAQAAQAGVNSEDEPTYTYDFYERLSNAEVAVDAPVTPGAPATAGAAAETPAASSTAPAPATASTAPATTQVAAATPDPNATRYLLLAGSFQNKEGAESRRTSIILLNMNANVTESIVNGRTLYAVQVGPFNGRRAAEDAGALLSSNNIESIPLRAPQ
jgi:cell division protein FtsN